MKILLDSVWGNTAVYNRRKLFLCLIRGHVLTDTVEDNDGRIDRITDNRQHACNESIADRNSCRRIERKYHQYVMYQCGSTLLAPNLTSLKRNHTYRSISL